MNKTGKNDLKRLISATKNSLAGLKAAWQNEAAFRLEVLGSLILIPAAFWVGETVVEWLLLTGSCLLLLITELLNSAVEAVVDRIGLEHHELSGRAKDIGSAAVLLSLVNLGIVWGIICYSHFFN
ncbi:MAG: diacylglycerol kinase [Proteobacteria bacterium]|nr:diacylglycerol kinase [Pseudomonadota bacterium]